MNALPSARIFRALPKTVPQKLLVPLQFRQLPTVRIRAMASAPENVTQVQKDLEQRNEQYAQTYGGRYLQVAPQRHYCVVTCMDARIAVFPAFGMALGDAHIIRNAGGSARDALRSVIISQQYLGTKEVLVIKHTKCGMALFTDPEADKMIEEKLGPKAVETMKGQQWHSFGKIGLEEAVKEDVEFLKSSGCLVEGTAVSGWTFDVELGRVKRIA